MLFVMLKFAFHKNYFLFCASDPLSVPQPWRFFLVQMLSADTPGQSPYIQRSDDRVIRNVCSRTRRGLVFSYKLKY